MDEQRAVARNVALQREWYGEPLGDRVRRLVVAFAVSQAQLAEVLGLSAPMLSQLMSGRRAKIGNPAVLARMVMLERRVLTPEVASGDPSAIRAALEQVRDSRPTVGRPTVSRSAGGGSTSGGSADGGETLPVERYGDEVLVPALRAVADPAELDAAARLLQEPFPSLAALLRRAAGPSQDIDAER
ncbi:MAG: helix-turn-helix transcriptional regulator [Pseudonocardiaceae bacterium]|nr:helix-turn-helix transcriptional regulator [Pseudonocardiaceae bacterium]